MFFVVWGWAILIGIVSGLILGIALAVIFGVFASTVPDEEVFEVLVGASVLFAVVIGGFGGFVAGLVPGLFAAGTAAFTQTKFPPIGTAGVSALVGTAVTLAGWVVPVARDGGQDAAIILFLIPSAVVFLVLFVIVFWAARRSRRAARGG